MRGKRVAAAVHRRYPDVWFATSDDPITWREKDMAPIFGPRPDNDWDNHIE